MTPDVLTPETLVDYGGPLNSMYEIQKHLAAHAFAWTTDRKRKEALEKTGQDLLDILATEMGDVPASLKVAERFLAFKAALPKDTG